MEPTQRKITSRGVAVACAAVILLLLGLVLSNGEVITLGVCGLLLLAGCHVLAPLNLSGLELSVQLPPRFFATRSVTALMELRNRRKVFDAWSVTITLRLPHKVERSGYAAWTPAQSSSALRERLSIPARAECSEVGCEIRSVFPLGLFEVRRSASVSCPMLVYPQQITPRELQWAGQQTELNPLSGAGRGDLFGEPRGIRPYQPGDKAARIHQFASAHALSRGQGLQVRACDPPGFHPDSCRIVLHSIAKSGEVIRLDRFERGLSLVAGTLAHFQGNRTKASFQADFIDWDCWPCESRAQYHECLSLLAKTRRAQQTKAQDLAEILRNTPPGEQLIIISDSPPDHWAALLPPAHRGAILVNIREVRFRPRNIQFQPPMAQ